jgi:hypothetical protein
MRRWIVKASTALAIGISLLSMSLPPRAMAAATCYIIACDDNGNCVIVGTIPCPH